MSPLFVFAEDNSSLKQDIDQIQNQVRDKQAHSQELEKMIQRYKQKIAQEESAVVTLKNQVALMENRIQEKQLILEQTKIQIESVNLQIQATEQEIAAAQAQLNRERESLGEFIRKIQEADRISVMDILLTRPSLSEFFARLDTLKRVEAELATTAEAVNASRMELQEKQKEQTAQQQNLQTQKQHLQKEQVSLAAERGGKISLIAETQNRDEEFQRILYELRQDQQATAGRLADLQDTLKGKLDSVDDALARGDILLNWPVRPWQGVSAKFHDPSYPFRRFFEHPGTDIPAPVGTPVHAAAGGYVAWNRKGKQYGNYVMLVHPGGIATVYAHLSRFATAPDTYVDRGDIIGYSGGKPGDEGAGLSTGPHLHFEVRQNGIPVNPENFLPSLD
ncbi:hypothetical protein EXS71_00455 [Candidatus Uhrbacteria bacterium]|nr:hypothetical protein [Candidatus Uhrbacteria bacterium]